MKSLCTFAEEQQKVLANASRSNVKSVVIVRLFPCFEVALNRIKPCRKTANSITFYKANSLSMEKINSLWRVLLLPLFVFVILTSCGGSSGTMMLTTQEAMDNFEKLSPIEGAQYLVENHEDFPFLDTLYVDSIMPVVLQCDYYDIKGVLDIIGDSLAGENYAEDLLQIRNDYLEKIHEEVFSTAELQKQTFIDCVLQSMQVEVDSMLNDDMDEVIDKYAGGFMNWRKLKFFFGTDSEKFVELWNKHIDNDKYTECVAKYINTYLDSLADYRNRYYQDVVGEGDFESGNRISQATMDLLLAKKCVKQVKQFTESEKSDITSDVLKDWVAPIVLGAVSGGASVVYDVATFAYDMKVTLDDIKSQKIEPEDQLKYICMENIGFQVREAYLKYYTERVLKNIDDNTESLYEQIKKNL